MKNIFLILTILASMSISAIAGATDTWQGKGRIAISSDGNMHDNDDWTATAMTLMILAEARLQNYLVLYTHSDHVWQSENNDLAEMVESAEVGAQKFGFDKADVFSAFNYPEKAYNAMRDQILASTAENPLFIIGAGPMHVIGTGFERANAIDPNALNYVTVISHSYWNNNHADKPGTNGPEVDHTGWTWDEMKTAFGSKVNFNKISDQNGTGSSPYDTDDRWSTTVASYYNWMDTHSDPNVNWVRSRSYSTKRYDCSDAGMAWYLVKNGDEDGDFMKLKAWVGDANVPTTGVGGPADPIDPVDPVDPTEKYVYVGVEDFTNLSAGAAPYYKDNARNALAINAGTVDDRDKMATADVTFTGKDGTYSLILTTLAEFDGESDYIIYVNGTQVGQFKNERVDESNDYKVLTFSVNDIALKNGDKLTVSSNAVTNGLIAEGSGTAYSRGRWTQLEVSGNATTDPVDPDPVDDDYAYGANWVAFEAEITKSDLGEWVIRNEGDEKYRQGTNAEGPIGKDYIEFTGNAESGGSANSPLVYTFVAPTTGTYRVTARMLQNLEGAAWDQSNDVYFKMEGDFESGIDGWTKSDLTTNQKFYGRGKDNWGALVNLEKGSAHAAALYKFKKGETYTMTVSGRSQRFCVDYFLIYENSLGLKVGEEVDIATENDKKYWPTAGTSVNPVEPQTQESYSGTPISLPGIIEAEDYDKGGEGVAYHDTETENKLGEYRTDGVDIETTSDTQGNYNIGWIATDEWLEYTIEVKTTGSYTFTLRHAAISEDGTVSILLDDKAIVSSLNLPSSGSWQDFVSTTSAEVSLVAGTYVLRLEIDKGNFNLNYIDVELISDETVSLNEISEDWFQNSNLNMKMFDISGIYMGSFKDKASLNTLTPGIYIMINTEANGIRQVRKLNIH